ncbi:hypothetical protein ANO11243_089360 [Dothideomycetidae sp. 11243]|nr:hypothetical protein ANO11243_089360 [fungal sp. No.11243]
MKLKLHTGTKAGSPTTAGSPPPPSAQTPTPSTGGFKLKIRTSAPPTPATEHAPNAVTVEPLAPPAVKPKRAYNKKPKDGTDAKKGGKRAADTDISPAPKRPAVDEPRRRISFKVSDSAYADEIRVATPTSAGPKLKLAPSRRASTGPKAITLTAKKRPPPRPVGVGYDSEASDAETDPAIEQQFVLRMPDPSAFDDETMRKRVRDDAQYLHTAIEEKKIGLSIPEGGADISFRFVSRDLRRAVITIRGTRYSAVMVDLPCVVESLKSWDRRGGWWKVADLAQMLLVIAPIPPDDDADEAAKRATLPRDIDRDMRYAHGLTPPMHYVRKRRFRKRVSHRDIEGVEEEVERLLREDKECESRGGQVRWRVYDGNAINSMANDDLDADGEYVESTEDPYGMGGGAPSITAETPQADEDDELNEADLLAGLENMDDEEEEEDAEGDIDATSFSIAAADATRSSSQAATPSAAAAPESSSDDESSSDEDDLPNGGGGGGGALLDDEDARAEANERAAARDEIADLEREVRNKRAEYNRVTNQLLRQRVRQNLQALEDELEMKRKASGLGEGDDEDGDDDGGDSEED